MHYLLLYDVVPDYVERRAQYRDEHLRLAHDAHHRGELLLGGALADPADGAVLLFQGDSPDVAQRFAEEDPYVRHGLVTRWRVRQWITVAGHRPSHPVDVPGAPRHEGAPGLGHATPILRVADIEASIAFYTTVLGFSLPWRTGDFCQVERDHAAIMLCQGDQGHAGTWAYVGVNDADAYWAEVEPRGAKRRVGPANYPWGAREVHVEDPDGHVLRFGSDAIEGEPLGEWLDGRGIRWIPDAEGNYRRADASQSPAPSQG